MTLIAAAHERDQGNEKVHYLSTIISRKMQQAMRRGIASIPNNLEVWIAHYLQFAVVGVRIAGKAQKIALTEIYTDVNNNGGMLSN